MIASAMNRTSTLACAMTKGGSLPVGASAFSAGIFRNDWNTATKQLR